MNAHEEFAREFVGKLQTLCRDRGSSAELRRWWSDATRHQAYPQLGRLGGIGNDRLELLAALYAIHPAHSDEGGGIGAAALRLGSNAERIPVYEKQFRRLLACTTLDDLGSQLHRLFKRLAREGIGLDFTRLLQDLNFWTTGHEDTVKSKWAAQFWRAPNP